MSDVIFARTRHTYDSYQDFWRLVELSGYATCYVDEIDPHSDNLYIFTPDNGETRNGWPGATARIIHYQLEWCTHPNDQHPPPPGVSEVWTMDTWHADRIGARYVPIGSHPGLRQSMPAQPPVYDIALMAYLSLRRQPVVHDLQRVGLRLAPNAWGDERDRILNRSRAVLHIHQHDNVPGMAALRVALAAAYGLPYISETVSDMGIFGYSHMLLSDYGNMADFARMWLHHNEARILEDYGRSLYQFLCVERTFRSVIEGAI